MAETPICAICIDPVIKKEEIQLPCSHSYHIECIKQMRKALCPQCNAPFGAVHKLGKDGLNEIKKRELLDIDEKKKVIAEEDARVAMELAQNERFELLNNINQEIAMLQQLIQQANPMMAPVNHPDPTPLTEEERININTALVLFFETNANELGHDEICQAAHTLVHNLRDNNDVVTSCDEIDELINIVSLAFEFPEPEEPEPVKPEYALNIDVSSDDELSS